MKKLLLIVVVLIFSLGNGILAKNIFININMSQFNRGDKTLVEFYYSFPDTALTFKYLDSGKYLGEILFHVEFYDNIKLVKSEKWIMPLQIEKYDGTYKQIFFGQKEMDLESGQYKVKVQVSDYNDSTSKAKVEFNYVIAKYDNKKIELSEIELASILERKDDAMRLWDKMFEKAGYYVIPNPSAEFYDDPGNLLFYCELYNAKTYSPNGVTLYYKVLNSTGSQKFRFKLNKPSSSDGIPITGEIPLNQLPTGVYYFDITALYPNNQTFDSVSTMKKFFYYNRFIEAEKNASFIENLTFEKSEFATISAKNLEEELGQAAVIASESEKKSMRSLNTDEAKQRFLFKFWAQRDPDTTTVLNEARDKYLKSIEYANINFKFGKVKAGWKTDRGKIYIKYGKPDEIKYNNSVNLLRAYDEWRYETLFGGCQFYFVDMSGNGNYKYVHSTAPGELYNPDWYKQFVDKESSNSTNNVTSPF